MGTYLHRKESIILTAVDLIDKLGIHQISIREIARAQGITEAAVYKHYRNKNELLLAVIEHFFKFDQDLFISARTRHDDRKEAVGFVLHAFAAYYENYPSLIAVLQTLDVLRYDPELKSSVNAYTKARYEFLATTIKQGQDPGTAYHALKSEIISDILMGTFNGICMRWRLEEHQFPLAERVMLAVRTILQAV